MIHEPERLMIMAYLYVVESADFLFLMRQTGLTAGNLSSHTSKLEAAGYIEVAGGVCGQKAAYDAPADRCGQGCISGVSGGEDAGSSVR
jgi:DNA-binding transcriptional ArsR family regulator